MRFRSPATILSRTEFAVTLTMSASILLSCGSWAILHSMIQIKFRPWRGQSARPRY